MRNGRAMRGHRRVREMIGTRVAMRRAPSVGWRVSCLCGWDGGVFPTTVRSAAAYRTHLDVTIDTVPRRCRRCGEEKMGTEMADRQSRYICKKCSAALGNEWQKRNPTASARHKRNSHLLTKFGITVSESEALLQSQGGVCGICACEITDKRGYAPHVDHDHRTGVIRGILCFGCNVGIGVLGDDPDRLEAAARYLRIKR